MCGEGRGGVLPDDTCYWSIAAALGACLAGVLTHSGHCYTGRSPDDMAAVAEAERARIVAAAERLRAAGQPCRSSRSAARPPRFMRASMDGVTDVRAGVYMFGDLFQARSAPIGSTTSR